MKLAGHFEGTIFESKLLIWCFCDIVSLNAAILTTDVESSFLGSITARYSTPSVPPKQRQQQTIERRQRKTQMKI